MSSEVQNRPSGPRGGRGSARGGRGGFSSRGGSRNSNRPAATNGDAKHEAEDVEDQGEIGRLKKEYGSKTGMIKEMFPDWSDVDILFALRETDGDENLTVTRIAEGSISQWGEVSKPKKERSKAKNKENTFTTTTGDTSSSGHARPSRGARAESGRGRGRATERGNRGSARAKSTAATNGSRSEKNQQSNPVETSAWGTEAAEDAAEGWGDAPAATTATATSPPKASTIPAGTQKTWASMLRQSTVPKVLAKPKEAPAPKPVEVAASPPDEPAEPEPTIEIVAEVAVEASVQPTVIVPEIALMPSKDQLTETNLDRVADDSHPPGTETQRSEAADSWDPAAPNIMSTATPVSASQQQHQKVPASGYAASAMKATDRLTTRTPSYNRRILDQEEAVRMPVNREVDRTTVQFGALNFSGMDDDIDGDREEPETRAQPPDDSPIAHPRASLPPASQSAAVPEAFPASNPATAILSASGSIGTIAPQAMPWTHSPNPRPAPPTAPAAQQAAAAPQATQPTAQAATYGRFGSASQEQSFGQKPFDAFGQQNQASSTPSQFEGFQNQQPSQAPTQPAAGAVSSAPDQYSPYYTADQHSRAPYNYYNQTYGQQQGGQAGAGQVGQGHQEAAAPQQRSFSGYNAPQSDNLSQYPQSGASRYSAAAAAAAADAHNSGNTTPNPPAQGQHGAGPQAAHGQAHGQQQPHAAAYPYNNSSTHPYYSSPAYYNAYLNQYGAGQYTQGSGGYGGPYGKGGFGQQQHPYGVNPAAPYDHSSSQASGFGQSSLHRGDSGLSSGLGEFGRAGAGQTGNQPGLGSSGFGSVHDSFGRAGSSYQSQAGQSFGAQASQQGAAPSAADDLKPYGDVKGAAGPSPSLGGARPGSATNTNPAGQSGLPPPQSAQQGGMGAYSGYPNHFQGHGLHGSGQSGAGAYGMGAGGAAQQSHGNTPYGSGGYGGQQQQQQPQQQQQGFGGSYYGNPARGWGGNYGQH